MKPEKYTKDFPKLTGSFKNSIKSWDYFVNWNKVFSNVPEFEIVLNKLNYLLWKKDVESEFRLLFKWNPDVVKAFPILLAVREKNFEIYDSILRKSYSLDFKSSVYPVDVYIDFLVKSWLIRLFRESGIKNLVDYVFGVEVWLDSNGRKNRWWNLMEDIVEVFITSFCAERWFEYMKQATASRILKEWGVSINVEKSERRYDFAIFNPNTLSLKLVETNFFNDGGSKLKAVCGEFKGLFLNLKNQGIDLIWITDGRWWVSALNPLEEAYLEMEYVFNLCMLEDWALERLSFDEA